MSALAVTVLITAKQEPNHTYIEGISQSTQKGHFNKTGYQLYLYKQNKLQITGLQNILQISLKKKMSMQ